MITSGPPPIRIADLPRSERPHDRLRALGAQALTSAELLAIIVGTASAGASAMGAGHALLTYARGSLRRLAVQPTAALTALPGIGPARAAAITAAFELGRRYVIEQTDGPVPIADPHDLYVYYRPRLEHLLVEEFHVAILDAKHCIQRDIMVTRGLVDSTPAHAREVFCEVIAERASAVILAHNHPSGDVRPSPEDHAITRRLARAGQLLDIPVRDHIIVGRGRYASFLELGLLP
jgi:DNA repair protein RadC